jgi:hypothetical protein
MRMCHNPFLSLRATEGSVAISLFPMHYGIASVVSLPRNDITNSLCDGGTLIQKLKQNKGVNHA